jgi:hypothetical protein
MFNDCGDEFSTVSFCFDATVSASNPAASYVRVVIQ